MTRAAIVALDGLGIFLASTFENQNIAYMATLAFAVSASTNFTVLILSLYWRGLTTRGVVIGGAAGLISTVTLLVLDILFVTTPGMAQVTTSQRQVGFGVGSPTRFIIQRR